MVKFKHYSVNIPPTKFSSLLKREIVISYGDLDFTGGTWRDEKYEIPLDSQVVNFKVREDYVRPFENPIRDGGSIFTVHLVDYKTENKQEEIKLNPEVTC